MRHSVQRQLTVAIENQPGRLAEIGEILGAHTINIKDLTIIDTVEQGVVRFLCDDPTAARALLMERGLYVLEAEVLTVDLEDAPGRLARLSKALADAGINIDYAYGSEGPAEDRMRLVLKVSNLTRASEVLAALPED
jgi:hypothetical protein